MLPSLRTIVQQWCGNLLNLRFSITTFIEEVKMKQNKILANMYLSGVFIALFGCIGTASAEFKLVESRSCVSKASFTLGSVFSWQYYIGTAVNEGRRYAETSLGTVNLLSNSKRFNFTNDRILIMLGMNQIDNNDVYWKLEKVISYNAYFMSDLTSVKLKTLSQLKSGVYQTTDMKYFQVAGGNIKELTLTSSRAPLWPGEKIPEQEFLMRFNGYTINPSYNDNLYTMKYSSTPSGSKAKPTNFINLQVECFPNKSENNSPAQPRCLPPPTSPKPGPANLVVDGVDDSNLIEPPESKGCKVNATIHLPQLPLDQVCKDKPNVIYKAVEGCVSNASNNIIDTSNDNLVKNNPDKPENSEKDED
jgi:hypothetical protein